MITKSRSALPSELSYGTIVQYIQRSWALPKQGVIVSNEPSYLEYGVPVWDVRIEDGKTHWGFADQFQIEEPEFDELSVQPPICPAHENDERPEFGPAAHYDGGKLADEGVT